MRRVSGKVRQEEARDGGGGGGGGLEECSRGNSITSCVTISKEQH